MPQVYNKHHNNAPTDAVYIGRGSIWGNPYRIGQHGTRAEVIAAYRNYLCDNLSLLAELPKLRDKDLVCFCKPAACHGDILLELANAPETGSDSRLACN